MLRKAVFAGAMLAAAVALSVAAGAVGDQQSPIIITGAIRADIQPLVITYRHGAMPFEVKNDGTTFKVSPKSGLYEVTYGGVAYRLTQFHFHHPAEHKAPGATPQLELHFVNENAASGQGVAIGVFIDQGAANAAFSAIMRNPPAKPTDPPVTVMLDPNDFLPADRHYWMYMGSLTTPAYGENIRWIVLKTHVSADAVSIGQYRALFRANAREVQALNRRFILEGPTP